PIEPEKKNGAASLAKDSDILRMQEKLDAAHAEIGRLRAKNGRLKDRNIVLEERFRSLPGNIGAATDNAGREDCSSFVEPDAGADCSSGEADASVTWRLNGQLLTVPLPKSLTEIKPWIDRYLGDKVVLAPKAQKAAEEAVLFNDVALVYKALLLLGTRADMLEGKDAEAAPFFNKMLKELRLEYGTSIRRMNKSFKPQYYAAWNEEKVFLERALKRGNSRDPNRCLRIYCAEKKTPERSFILVGHLPTHLDNRIT
ncbi:MAG: hypothetical protein KGI97_06920, partial [Alphaproteobacteria bacterium]|nr:hypothetical protein [Alphaproteobacteria bacterium]